MSGYRHSLIDSIRPDFPGESVIRVVAHTGDVNFIGIEVMEGNTEVVGLELNREQARALADTLRIAADSMPDLR